MKRCERCSVVLCCDDLVMRARDAIFHLRCFTCIVCDVQLRPGQMFAMADNGTLYCQGYNVNIISFINIINIFG